MCAGTHPMSGQAQHFGLGQHVQCKQTGTRFRVIGEPRHCSYLPTDEPVYILAADSLDSDVIVVPQRQVEADMLSCGRQVQGNPILDRPVPSITSRRGD